MSKLGEESQNFNSLLLCIIINSEKKKHYKKLVYLIKYVSIFVDSIHIQDVSQVIIITLCRIMFNLVYRKMVLKIEDKIFLIQFSSVILYVVEGMLHQAHNNFITYILTCIKRSSFAYIYASRVLIESYDFCMHFAYSKVEPKALLFYIFNFYPQNRKFQL